MKGDNMSDKFKNWCVIELMGHQRIAGMVTEEEISGQLFLRIDVPAVSGNPPFTRYYGSAAVYSISPVTQEVVMIVLSNMYIEPVIKIDIPALKLQNKDIQDFDTFEETEIPDCANHG